MPLLVNGQTIDDAEIRAEERSIRPKLHESLRGEDHASIETKVKSWARENLVERHLLQRAAAEAHPTLTLDEAIKTFLDKVTENVARPRNKDVVEYYRKHRQHFVLDEMVQAGHVLKESAEAIEETRRLLSEGVLFEALPDFADLGFLPRGETVPPFEKVIFSLAPGQVSAPFQTQFGFHIAKVYAHRPAGIPALDEIRSRIEEVLYQQKRQKVIDQYLDRLRARADISVA